MKNPFLSAQNSALRVFSACLLSSLLIMMPFVQLAAASRRESGVRSRGPESGRQTSDSEQKGSATNAAAENVFLNAPVPKPAPEPPALLPVIVATKDDGLAAATTVAPGGTITYTVNINNTSPTDSATNVQFSDQIDGHTTLVSGSAVAAVSDKYNTIGNVQISVPDGSTDLLGNDFDPDTGNNAGMTVTAETKSSTSCTGGCSGNVTINADGSFTYDPPVGFSGTDTFTYTAISGGSTAAQTVTITVANEIWFIKNAGAVGGACAANCDGRLSHPFPTLAAFNAANLGGAGQPGDNDWIFVFESTTDYTGPATLRTGQKFIGQDATSSLATLTGFTQPSGTDPLPAMNPGNGTFVNISGTNVNGINLNSGNTLRGFRVGNVGTGTKISGTNFGTLVVGDSGAPDVLLQGTGRALNLTTGTLAVTGGFINVTTTSSAAQGISLSGVADSDGAGAGLFSFGSTTVSGSTSEGILVTGSTADLNFGTTSVTGGTDGVSLQNNSSGTRTFGMLGISGSSGIGFRHLDPDGATVTQKDGGNVTVTGTAALSSAGSAISVSAGTTNSTTAINFQAATSATTTGAGVTAVSWVGAANTSMTFNSLSITRNNGTALDASVAGTINVTTNGGSITNTTPGGPAIVAANITLNANFSQINSTGGNNAVNLTTVDGTSNFGGGQLTGTSGGATFQVAGGTASVTYSGNITQGAAAAMVNISNHATGTILFQTGTLLASLGTGLIFNNADGTYTFNGTNTISGSNAHVQITNGSVGAFSFSSNTTVTNPSAAPAFDVSGGSASAPNITYSGTLTQNTAAQRAINISGISGGTETFSGAITSNGGAGVSIEGTGGTVNISGNMTLNNTASVYKACSGTCASPSGTGLHISVTGSNNTVGATNAAATRGVQIDGAQIDAGGVTFKSIAVNGSSTDGILVKNTGSSGFFTVVGNGSAGTGGTIQNVTNRGASFITTRNITLNWMNFTNANTADGATSDGIVGGNENTDENGAIHLATVINASLSNITISGTTSQHGINGNTVTNLDLTNVTINTAGDEVWESGIFMFHLRGVPSASQDSIWDNVDINDTGQFNISIINASGTNAAGGEKDKLTIQNGSSFKNSGKNVIGDHISNFNSVTANFQIVVNAATFDSKINGEYAGAHTSDGIQVDVSGASARFDATINGCTFTSTTGGGVGQSAINISSTTGAGTFNVTNNNATVRQGAGINVAVTGTAALTGHITGNTLSTNITNNPSFGINMVTEGNGSMIVDVQNNSIQGSGSGIGTTTAFDYGIRGGARAGSGSAQFVIKGNTVQTAKGAGTWLFAGNNTAGETSTTCVNFSTGNTIDADYPTQAFTEYFLEQYTGTTFRIQGLSGSGTNATNVATFVANTDLDPSPTDPAASAGGGTVVNYTNAVCSTAPLLLAEGGIESALPSRCSGSAPFAIDAQVDQFNELSLAGFLGANSTPDVPTTVSTSLTTEGLNTIVTAAKARWLRSGLSTSQANVVANLMFEIGDLADGFLGEANGNRILVDQDAQGKGWFIDATPANDFEFGERTSATRSYTNPFTSAAGRIDLLTAIEHEIGHRLGLSDSYSENDRDSIMYGYLTVGERRVPATGQAANAQAGLTGKHFLKLEEEKARDTKEAAASRRNHVVTSRAMTAPVSGETVTANIGTLPAGGSVTITFQVMVNNPPNLTLLNAPGPRVENQGTVSFNEVGSPVLTDDPTVVGSADKTATLIDLYGTTTTVITNNSPSAQGDPVTFTATVAPNNLPFAPPGGTVPAGTVQFLDGATPITCDEGSTSTQTLNGSSQATCTTSALSGGAHTINVNYSGNGNFDPSAGNVAQTVIPCTTNPVVTSTADPGDGSCATGGCTLREAITEACSGSTITFATGAGEAFENGGTITLNGTELSVGRNVTINGPALATQAVTVSGNNASRVFHLNPNKTATIRNLSIRNGLANGASHPDDSGGGIFNEGNLTLINSTVSGNVATAFGGGIYSWASVGTATLQVVNSTFTGNQTTGGTSTGGGVMINSATATLLNSTFSANTSVNGGGGVMVNFGTTTITNCTIVDNTATTGGGGVRADLTVILRNTIVANSTAPDDITGSFDTTNGFNLIEDPGAVVIAANNITGQDPVLGPLASNGGRTQTHALLATSPAIEAGSNANLPVDTFDVDGDADTAETLPVDQRGLGYPRTADSADADTTQTVDIGAFELHPSIENIGNQNTNEDTPIPVTFNLGDDTGSLITGGSVTATSSNATLVPNMPANLAFTGSGGSRTLTITPASNESGTTTITVTVTATNGRTATDTFDLTVTGTNDNPTLTNNTGLTVNEASAGNVIDNTKLKVDDVDNTTAQLTFTVGTAPANGTLKNNGVGLSSGGTFTQADIDSSLLTYDHDGSETTADSFTFTVSDGAGGSIGSTTFNITVTPQNDAPTLGNNTGTTVNEGSTGNIIDSAKLSVNDVDNTPAQLTFTVGSAPANGTLKNNGVGLTSGGTFTQQDINNNLLTYDHDGTETTSDSFSFTVSDGAGGSIASNTFNITVTPQNDGPTVTATGANLAYAEGDPTTAIDSGLTVTDGDSANLTGASASITANFQSGQDVLGWVDNNLADNITLDGSSTAQTIVLTGTDTPANYQAALRAVTYQNSSENPSTLTRTVTFTANDGTTTGQGTRGIDVSAVNDTPTLTTNAGLSVVNAGTGTIDNTKLKVDDVDNSAAQLTYTVGTATANGTLKKGAATLAAGGTFTQADIDGNQITYTHNGTATTTDSFTFTVSDGAGGSIGSTTFNITIGSPNVSINDAKVAEPVSPNTVDMTFTVALAVPAGASGSSVNFTTNDGTATAGTCGNPGADYVLTTGQVTFGSGEQVKTINVPVCSDAVADDGETFTITLSGAVNATIVDGNATGTITGNTPGTLLISELRTSGPGGAGDDFVEIYNNTNAAITVPAGGYGLFKMGTDCNATPVLIATIPAGRVIPARGHYLFTGPAYSLANYGGTNAATGDNLNEVPPQPIADIATDANLGLFSTADVTQISSANRLDAVGFGVNVGGSCNLLREGSTLPSVIGNETTQHSFFRKMCEWMPGAGCTLGGQTKDTNNNAADFWLADTAGSAFTGRLGAPGPENLGSPIRRDNATNPGSGGINVFLLDGNVGPSAQPNRERNGSDSGAGTFGSMTLRYRVTNNTGGNVTRLRYRIVDVSTYNSPAGTADLRALTGVVETGPSAVGPVTDPVTCTAGGAGAPPCTVTVTATTLEMPPNQGIGGGYNSTLSSGTITTIQPLNNGSSILINFKLGVEKTGTFRFYIIVEALP